MSPVTYRRGLSTKELILSAIQYHTDEYGYAPTVREIGKIVGISSSASVHYWIDRLEKEGRLSRKKGKQRTLKVLGKKMGVKGAKHGQQRRNRTYN